MGHIMGCNGYFAIEDSSAASQNISGDGNQVSMKFTADAPETVTLGSCTKKRLSGGLKDVSFDFSGYWNATATSGIDAIFYGILGGSSRVVWCPNGSLSGCPLYTTCVVCTDYSVNSPADGIVTATATFVNRTGSLTRVACV